LPAAIPKSRQFSVDLLCRLGTLLPRRDREELVRRNDVRALTAA
jgi:hypothetical protein